MPVPFTSEQKSSVFGGQKFWRSGRDDERAAKEFGKVSYGAGGSLNPPLTNRRLTLLLCNTIGNMGYGVNFRVNGKLSGNLTLTWKVAEKKQRRES